MFLHEEEHIRYIHFDMARSNKRTTNVMAKLGDIGKQRSGSKYIEIVFTNFFSILSSKSCEPSWHFQSWTKIQESKWCLFVK